MPLPTLAYRLIGRFSVTRFAQVVHPILYRRTGGAGILGRSLGARTILLTTIGRRSGKARTVPLYAFPLERPPGAWAVVGSRGGSREIPAWFRNIQDRPGVTVQVDRVVVPSRAREASGEEYEAIFQQAAAVYPGYHLYRRESPVHIPIVVLAPTGGLASEVAPGASVGALGFPGKRDSDERA